MNSIAFPWIFKDTTTNVVEDIDATRSNMRLLLTSDQLGLFGDPAFGTNIKRLLFEQNNNVLRDIVIDDIYTAILQFMPQVLVDRKDIKITTNGSTLQAKIKALNMLDYTTNLYVLNLLNYEDVQA